MEEKKKYVMIATVTLSVGKGSPYKASRKSYSLAFLTNKRNDKHSEGVVHEWAKGIKEGLEAQNEGLKLNVSARFEYTKIIDFLIAEGYKDDLRRTENNN